MSTAGSQSSNSPILDLETELSLVGFQIDTLSDEIANFSSKETISQDAREVLGLEIKELSEKILKFVRTADPESVGQLRQSQARLSQLKVNLYSQHRTQNLQACGEPLNVSPPTSIEFMEPQRLPKFDSDILKWARFSTLFRKALAPFPRMDSQQKFSLLLSCLSGPALTSVDPIPIEGDEPFEVAWKTLENLYQNNRRIFTDVSSRFFSIPPVTDVNSLRHLLDQAKAMLLALESFKIDTTSYHIILVPYLEAKLDSKNKERWSEQYKKQEVNQFEEFFEFLTERLNILEAENASKDLTHFLKTNNRETPQQREFKSPSSFAKTSQLRCPLCQGIHYVRKCPSFLAASVEDRWNLIRSNRLCHICFDSHHTTGCISKFTCSICKGRHATYLHKTSVVSPKVAHFTSSNPQVILPTVVVEIKNKLGEFIKVRALLDSGATHSAITEELCLKLGISTTEESHEVYGFNNIRTTAKHVKNISFRGVSMGSDESHTINASVVPSIVGPIPINSIPQGLRSKWKHLKGYQLADPEYFKSGSIELLLDAGTTWELQRSRAVRYQGAPGLFETTVGWVVQGHTGKVEKTAQISCFAAVPNLEKFWEVEEVPAGATLTPEEARVERHFTETTKIKRCGSFQVNLPVAEPSVRLGASIGQALSRLKSLENQFDRFPVKREPYKLAMQSYIDKGELVLAEPLSKPHVTHYFLPHHAVCVPNKALRVVFDASAKTTSGYSLNQVLTNGPKLQHDLADHLLRFRIFPIGITADVEHMYRQIHINPDQHNLQRVLWRSSSRESIKQYVMERLTFGTKPAPYLATRVLLEISNMYRLTHPIESNTIKNHFYMDDLLSGAHTQKEADQIRQGVSTLLRNHGFKLHKWASSGVSWEETSDTKQFQDDQGRVLGLIWNHVLDVFSVRPTLRTHPILTKRLILSETNSIYDPLGFIAPITITLKILLQQLWQDSYNWDMPLPQGIVEKFNDQVNALSKGPIFEIPRHIFSESEGVISYHAFADASEKAYAAVVYARVSTTSGIKVTLVAAKTRVAPIKTLSLPRLELSAAFLLSKLVKWMRPLLPDAPWQAYSDSTITLNWLEGSPNRWRTFVANRVSAIQQVLPFSTWQYVPSNQNPADIASRGVGLDMLLDGLWLKGPSFLHLEPLPDPIPYSRPRESHELKPAIVMATIFVPNTIVTHNNARKTVRVYAYVLRFLRRYRPPHTYISIAELRSAEKVIIKVIQSEHFLQDIKALRKSKCVPLSSNLKHMCPFLDSGGILRVGGRLTQATIDDNRKYPIILPPNSPWVKSLIWSSHKEHLHATTSLMVTIIKLNYYIPRLRTLIRATISKCIVCARMRAKLSSQLMADLPAVRVNPSRPFTHTGVDFAGPFSIKNTHSRGGKIFKAYICVFVCFSTRAIHIELVSDMSTPNFMAALHRMASRRGVPSTITSDNGTNFVGASRQIYNFIKNEATQAALAQKGFLWKFNPPSAPHFGGIWEAGVRSLKYHLKRVLGPHTLNFEEMSTLLTSIEATLNSRPLVEIAEDETSLEALTPGHFLIGAPLIAPPPIVPETKTPIRRRWQLIQAMTTGFWKRWRSEYLTTLQTRPKWTSPKPNVTVGQLVLIKTPNCAPLQWPLGRVTHTHPGPDGLVRVIDIRTATTTLRRPITAIVQLPLTTVEAAPKDI